MAAGPVRFSSGKQASRQQSGHTWGTISGWGLCNAGMPAVTGIQVCGRYPDKLSTSFDVYALYQWEGIALSASHIVLL